MDKIWYILIKGIKEGPYSVDQLRCDTRITPDTWVWREGFEEWVPAREVEELQIIFKDEEQEEENTNINQPSNEIVEDDVIALQRDPSFNFLWLILVLILLYVLYLFNM